MYTPVIMFSLQFFICFIYIPSSYRIFTQYEWCIWNIEWTLDLFWKHLINKEIRFYFAYHIACRPTYRCMPIFNINIQTRSNNTDYSNKHAHPYAFPNLITWNRRQFYNSLSFLAHIDSHGPTTEISRQHLSYTGFLTQWTPRSALSGSRIYNVIYEHMLQVKVMSILVEFL